MEHSDIWKKRNESEKKGKMKKLLRLWLKIHKFDKLFAIGLFSIIIGFSLFGAVVYRNQIWGSISFLVILFAWLILMKMQSLKYPLEPKC